MPTNASFELASQIAERLSRFGDGSQSGTPSPPVGLPGSSPAPTSVLGCLSELAAALQPLVPILTPPPDVLRAVYNRLSEANPVACRIKAAAILLRSLRTPPTAALRTLHDVCRTEGSTALLSSDQLLDPIVQLIADPPASTDANALGHALAILRYASSESSTLVHRLVTLGAIPALSKALTRLLGAARAAAAVPAASDAAPTSAAATSLPRATDEAISNAMECLRAFSDGFAHHVVKFGCLELMLDVVDDPAFSQCEQMCLTTVRALSFLASGSETLAMLQRRLVDCVPAMCAMMDRHADSPLILSQLSWVVASVLHDAPLELIGEMVSVAPHALELMTLLLLRASAALADAASDATGEAPRSADDIALNLARALANASLCPAAGRYLLNEAGVVNVLGHVLRSHNDGSAEKEDDSAVRSDTRVALYTLMCLSNVSFYWSEFEKQDAAVAGGADEAPSGDDDKDDDQADDGGDGGERADNSAAPGSRKNGHASKVLHKFLDLVGPPLAAVIIGQEDVESAVEAARVLGNVSNTDAGREWLRSTRLDEACCVLVHATGRDRRLLYNCLGVLVNLSSDGSRHALELCEDNDVGKVIDVWLNKGTRAVDAEEAELVALSRQLQHNLSVCRRS